MERHASPPGATNNECVRAPISVVLDTQQIHVNDELLELDYTEIMSDTSPRARLAKVLRHTNGVVTLDDISEALDLGRTDASKTAARWVSQGRLTRIRPGLFAPVPLDSEPETSGLSDLWQIVPDLFGTAFITGWSAAEHWDLTEQLFRRACVKTTSPVRQNIVSVRDGEFFVTHVREDLVFGIRTHWADRVRVQIADPHRTIIDMLDDPRLGGGGRHTKDCVASYLRFEFAETKTLIQYADRIGNGAVFKRLGFLGEHITGSGDRLIQECRRRLTAGYADFDPAVKGGRVVTRWRVRVPEQILEDFAS